MANIGEIWFGIRIPKQGGFNPLMDMMGNMLFGGAGAAPKSTPSPSTPRSGTPKPAAKPVEAKKSEPAPPAPPPTMDLD